MKNSTMQTPILLPRNISLRLPVPRDGKPVNRLIAGCRPLDTNSVYCNLLQCTHFADTSVIAEMNGEICGFVSGYVKPQAPEVLFIWQVAVDERARGCRLGTTMIRHLLERTACSDVRYVETSITPDNAASWSLFRSVARDFGAALASRPWFSSAVHFDYEHDDEELVRIGPLPARKSEHVPATLKTLMK